ncbi:hypothetical protein [Bailinhaonella thermotolerans]|uniref:Uncharacterized protein n=1 Tax=Bailinhaonella thermotolerans TaxID=1070861 RepID=A0A3A4ALK3_9ACTN|nr:hypothetical protein [Bailinhaonella thermotolerans]RJL26550.1 hypothetical protein D5H75_26575 [Bailinhaonella thermotolerans]
MRQQGWSLTYATWALWGREDQESKVTALEHTHRAAECFQRAGDADEPAQALVGIGNVPPPAGPPLAVPSVGLPLPDVTPSGPRRGPVSAPRP